MCVAEAYCDGCFPINQPGVCDDGDDNTTADTRVEAGANHRWSWACLALVVV